MSVKKLYVLFDKHDVLVQFISEKHALPLRISKQKFVEYFQCYTHGRLEKKTYTCLGLVFENKNPIAEIPFTLRTEANQAYFFDVDDENRVVFCTHNEKTKPNENVSEEEEDEISEFSESSSDEIEEDSSPILYSVSRDLSSKSQGGHRKAKKRRRSSTSSGRSTQ